jgi:hypothetical protein
VIDRHLERRWPPEVTQALDRFKQGDLIERPPFFFGAPPEPRIWDVGEVDDDPAGDASQINELHPDDGPPFGVITTQTCDLAEQGPPTQPWFQVSPVYALEGDAASQAESLRKNYIIALTGSGLGAGTWVADLRIELPLEKTFLAGRIPICGFETEDEAEGFGRALGERRARAALANDLVESITGLLRRRKANNKSARRRSGPACTRSAYRSRRGRDSVDQNLA